MISYLKELENIGAKKEISDDDLVDAEHSLLGQQIQKNSSSKGSEITLTNNKIQVINMKVIKSLENRGILSKGITRIIISQE